MRCPFTSNQYGNMPFCQDNKCMLYDETCLLRKALQVYIENNTLIKAYNYFAEDNTIMESQVR